MEGFPKLRPPPDLEIWGMMVSELRSLDSLLLSVTSSPRLEVARCPGQQPEQQHKGAGMLPSLARVRPADRPQRDSAPPTLPPTAPSLSGLSSHMLCFLVFWFCCFPPRTVGSLLLQPFSCTGLPMGVCRGQAYPTPLCQWPLSWGLSSHPREGGATGIPAVASGQATRCAELNPLLPGWGSQEQHWREGQEPTWV